MRRERSVTQLNCTGSFDQDVMPHFDAAYNLARWLARHVLQANLRGPGNAAGHGNVALIASTRCTSAILRYREQREW